MLKRIDSEKREFDLLSPYAKKAQDSEGRAILESPCEYRTVFQRDRDRIIHSKAFRRLMHKTQVFLSPEGDHFRTRLMHTLEVAQISKSIARALLLNEDLTEAIAMGHDLGHTPFGHSGEEILDKLMKEGFKHNEQSVRVVTILENSGNFDIKGRPFRGMNLTTEVIDGIRNHTDDIAPSTLEGRIVKIADRIAYLNHDLDDAIRSGILNIIELPSEFTKTLGSTTKQRIDTLVTDIIISSDGLDDIVQSEICKTSMDRLRSYMFKRVYLNKEVRKEGEINKIRHLITSFLEYYAQYSDNLPAEYRELLGQYDEYEVAKDYIAGMTDRFAIETYKKLFVPSGWNVDMVQANGVIS